MQKKYILTVFAIILCFFVSSCSLSEINNKNDKLQLNTQIPNNQDDITDMGPVRGGTLKLFSTVPDTLNPIMTNNVYVKDFCGLIYESLIAPDSQQKPVPMLSDKWDVSDDGLTWTFHIREGVFWHDKIPLTADDVEFTFKTILNPEVNSIYKVNLQNITTFAAVDRNNFRIILRKPYSFTAEQMNIPIIPKHCFAGEDILKSQRNMNPVGTGPYKFSSYSDKSEIKLVLNDDWWRSKTTDSDALKGPYITEVSIKIYDNGKDSVNAFQTRDVDLAFIDSGVLNRYNGRSELILKRYPGKEYEFISFNLTKPVFSDKVIRQAISYAIDKNEIINEALPGEAVASDLPVIPGTWLNDKDVISVSSDIAKSKELLASSGWKDNNGEIYKDINGVYTPLNFELLVNDDNELRYKVAENIKSQLKQIGINLQIKRVNWDEEFKIINSRKFDLVLTGYDITSIPDISFAYSSAEISSGMNVSGYSNPNIDSYLDKIASENDSSKKKALFINMKEILMDEVPYIGLYFYTDGVIYNKRIKGEFTPYTWNKYDDITKWYIPNY